MSIRSLNILIADDEPSVAESLLLVFRPRGHRIEAVSDGLKAFTLISENPGKFDVLIADNTMPGLTGSELIQKLREVDFGGKIVVLSGHLTPELESIYHGLGVDDIIHKPYDLSSVRSSVERIAIGADAAERE